jgi:uncharacterized protein
MMAQTLADQLFVHHRVSLEKLRRHVPAGLEIDEHSGSGWLGVTPFVVTGLRLRGTLPLPRLSTFLQLNARTYVTRDGRPGIWFFSLDASSRVAAEVARRVYRVPFSYAEISLRRPGDRLVFESARDPGRAFAASYRPSGLASRAETGSLEHFLTERYCLYAEDHGRLLRGEIHHRPWPLQPAEADVELNTMAPEGIELGDDPLLHYSSREDVLLWPLERAV